jgi:hypothetical protein
MEELLSRVLHSLAEQTGNWFVGFVLALLAVFSGRLVEKVKFALNRADLRAKYYEELAVEVSNFVFSVDRLVKVYYGSHWASDDDKSAIAGMYNEAMNTISRKEYVYLSWLRRYWRKKTADAFVLTMQAIRAVDSALINLNEINERAGQKNALGTVESEFRNLQKAAQALLAAAV